MKTMYILTRTSGEYDSWTRDVHGVTDDVLVANAWMNLGVGGDYSNELTSSPSTCLTKASILKLLGGLTPHVIRCASAVTVSCITPSGAAS